MIIVMVENNISVSQYSVPSTVCPREAIFAVYHWEKGQKGFGCDATGWLFIFLFCMKIKQQGCISLPKCHTFGIRWYFFCEAGEFHSNLSQPFQSRSQTACAAPKRKCDIPVSRVNCRVHTVM